MARTGRRPGQSGSREKILAAARSHFAKDGFDHATVRAIAATARVDPALVLHFFGSKHELFIAAMELPFDPLFGLGVIRYVMKLEPLASASPDEVAKWVGPNLQRYFTADLGDHDVGRPVARAGRR